MNAVSPPKDLPLAALCTEVVVGNAAIIVVGGGVGDDGAIPCPPRHALQAACLLVSHALDLEPDLAWRSETVRPMAELLGELWQAANSYLPQLLKMEECTALRGVIDREVRSRVAEELIGLRDASRKKGLGEAAEVIRNLVAIVGEPDDRVRSIAMAALHQEIARATGDLDAGISR
jgi:hypothetical protein